VEVGAVTCVGDFVTSDLPGCIHCLLEVSILRERNVIMYMFVVGFRISDTIIDAF